MAASNIVRGQSVHGDKVNRAKELRRTMTADETILWDHLRDRRLGGFKFRRQQLIDGYIADFYCHSAGIVVEADGPVHEEQQQYDQVRDGVFLRRGIATLRFTNAEIRADVASVLKRILDGCERSDLTPPAPLSEAERGE